MKTLLLFTKASLTVLLVMNVIICASAQKLSSVQETPVPAPAKVKIDGKIDEWGQNFQAYNKVTKLYYLLSNDEKNLYLVVKSTDVQNNTKVMGGGVTLTINTADKKKEENAYSITFPIVNRSSLRGIRRPRGASATTVMDITDTLISIYNTYGIKAAAGYDEQANLQFELSIPLALLNLSANNPKEFAYNLRVNGIQMGNNRNGGNDGGGRNGGGFGGGNPGGGFGGGGNGGGGGGGNRGGFGGAGNGGAGGGNRGPGGGMDAMNEMLSATDFWAKYTLIKK
jgi:hypothetical protein